MVRGWCVCMCRPGERKPLGGGSVPAQQTTHTDSNSSFALSSPGPIIYKPIRAPFVSRFGSSPFLLLLSQHFNLSPLCRHPSQYKYRCQSSIPPFDPTIIPPHPLYPMPQGVLPPIRDILPGPFYFLSLLLSHTHCPPTLKQVFCTMNTHHLNPHHSQIMGRCRSRTPEPSRA